MQYTHPNPVSVTDIDRIVRDCDFPAMRDNPLQLIMFPSSSPETQESEIQFTINGFKRTIQRGQAIFRKVCTAADGTPVGFAGWVSSTPPVRVRSGPREQVEDHPDPVSLDVEAWSAVSKLLREERERVLQDRKDVWRLITLSVNPAHQRQGVGSMLVQWGCQAADQAGQDSFVMASPAAVKLYRKFGYKVQGEVRTEKGTFTSMYRKAQELPKYIL
ncbi:hypothetical protein ABW21_db0209522 [Orbilia brochopaga]|nr:hypothetical protein ABW21_db0209522 [Drechslerella brochopaga]